MERYISYFVTLYKKRTHNEFKNVSSSSRFRYYYYNTQRFSFIFNALRIEIKFNKYWISMNNSRFSSKGASNGCTVWGDTLLRDVIPRR